MSSPNAIIHVWNLKVRELLRSRIARETGWLAVAKLVQGVTSILATFVVARYLGPRAFGELSLAMAIASIIATGTALGLEHIVTRELASDGSSAGRHGSRLAVWQRLRTFGAVAGGVLLLMSAYSNFAQRYGIAMLLVVLSLLPLAQIGDLSEWRLIANGYSRKVATVVIWVSPIAALLRLALALLSSSLIAFAWILIVEWAVRSALLKLSTRSLPALGVARSKSTLSTAIGMLRESIPLLLSDLAVMVYMRVDQFMIAGLLDATQVGLYSAIVMLAGVPLVLPVLLLRGALPALSRKFDEDPEAMERILVQIMRYMFLLHVALAVLLALVAEAVVTTLYGEAYQSATLAFRVQVVGAPFVVLDVLSASWLVLKRYTSFALWRALLGATVNVGLNTVLIPRFGIAGAACATVCAFVTAAFLSDALFSRTRPLFLLKVRALTGFHPRLSG